MLERPKKIVFKPVNQSCWIEAKPGQPLLHCRIREISDRDAKEEASAPSEIRDEFVMLLTADGRVTRRCHVVQRSDKELDVKFISGEVTPIPSESVKPLPSETAKPPSSETVKLET